jgi:hypothetical protein
MINPKCVITFLTVLMLSAIGFPGFSQQLMSVSGVVKDMEDGSRVADARITNQRTGASSQSSSLGLFQLMAAVGDTLLITKRDYSDYTAPVPFDKAMIILLNRERTLKEVNIVGQSKKSELNDIQREYKRKGSFYQGKPPLLAFIFSPLTALYEVFGGTPKKARRFSRYYETEMQQSLIDGFFNETAVRQQTGLEGQELEKFMLDYRPEYEKAKNWAEYDAMRHIKSSYKKYTDTLKK